MNPYGRILLAGAPYPCRAVGEAVAAGPAADERLVVQGGGRRRAGGAVPRFERRNEVGYFALRSVQQGATRWIGHGAKTRFWWYAMKSGDGRSPGASGTACRRRPWRARYASPLSNSVWMRRLTSMWWSLVIVR